MWKSSLKFLKRALILISVLLLSYFILAFSLSFLGTRPPKLECAALDTLYVTSNGIHLDLILPRHLIGEELQMGMKLDPATQFVGFGWGDKGFYLETPTWADLRFRTAVKALFLKSGTAMHLTFYHRARPDWIKIPVCGQQVELLNEYLASGFQKDQNGSFLEIPDAGYTSRDRFYEAEGSYNCLNTCNNWINRGLKKAKIKTSLWAPFDQGVLYHARKNNPN